VLLQSVIWDRRSENMRRHIDRSPDQCGIPRQRDEHGKGDQRELKLQHRGPPYDVSRPSRAFGADPAQVVNKITAAEVRRESQQK
jgi:hypothetical protein